MHPKCKAADFGAADKLFVSVACVLCPKDPTLKQDCCAHPHATRISPHQLLVLHPRPSLTTMLCHPLLLQEELEAYDRHQRLLEDNLDSKTAEIIQLRRAALEAAAGQLQQVRTMTRGCVWRPAVPDGTFVSFCHLGDFGHMHCPVLWLFQYRAVDASRGSENDVVNWLRTFVCWERRGYAWWLCLVIGKRAQVCVYCLLRPSDTCSRTAERGAARWFVPGQHLPAVCRGHRCVDIVCCRHHDAGPRR